MNRHNASAMKGEPMNVHGSDLISRQAAIDLLWKALFEYEDKTEKQFQESEDLDVGDWIQYRIFVQKMSDTDRQTILGMPSIDAVPIVRCKDCKWWGDYGCAIRIVDESDKPKENDFCSFGERKDDE